MRYLYFALFFFYSCQQSTSESISADLFAPEKVSTAAPEFAITLNTSETEVYFNRTSPDRSVMQIMQCVQVDGNWSTATTLPFSTGTFRDVDPFLTGDGQRLYFSSDRPVDTIHKAGVFNTWYVQRKGDSWSSPINPGAPLNSDSTEIFISLSQAGHAYFTSERDGTRSIWRSVFANGTFQVPEKITLRLNGEIISAGNPCIASDERFMIVAARDPVAQGPPDLYLSYNQNGQWSDLIHLGPEVNSPFADFAPALSKDDQYLYFTSERPGMMPATEEGVRPPGDIYRIRLDKLLSKL